ncbi:MAG: sodium:solute symporter family protein [Rickettsiaceae bacterium]|jgi:Na+/proline symporter|nr:sodium:solute symporter family protein [Rickettsiaceae bacterium]
MSNVEFIMVFFYLTLTLVLGLWSGRNVKNMTDYAVGGRNFSTQTLVMTICATNIGGSTIISLSSQTFKVGLIHMIAVAGIVLDNLLTAYILAPRVKHFLGLISLGEVINVIYGKTGRYITAISGTLVSIGFVAGQVKALSIFFNYFLDIPFLASTLISCFIIIAYSSFGGIKAVTFTDTIQFITLAVTMPMIYNVSLEFMNGYEELFKRIPEAHLTIIENKSFPQYLMLFLFFSFPGILPTTMQRILMAKDTRQVHNSFKISALTILPYRFIAGMIGLVALALNPDLPPNDAFMFLIDTHLPSGLKGMAIIGMIAIVMSTADSHINAASVSFTHDLLKPLYNDKLSDKAELKIARYFSLISGIFIVIIALSFDNLLKLILFVQGFYVPIVSMPLLLGIFGFRSSERTFLAGAAAGGLTFLIWKLYDLDNVMGFDSIIPGVAANAIALLSTHYLLKEKGGWVKDRTVQTTKF